MESEKKVNEYFPGIGRSALKAKGRNPMAFVIMTLKKVVYGVR